MEAVMNNRLSKRKHRRRAVANIVRRIEEIQDFEFKYMMSIPDTKANEDRQEESEYAFSTLSEVVESLRDII